MIFFDNPLSSTIPTTLPISGRDFVAPYWAHVDTSVTGQVYYRYTTDVGLLARATSEIRAAFPEYQNTTMKSLVITTWYRVGYFSSSGQNSNKVRFYSLHLYA